MNIKLTASNDGELLSHIICGGTHFPHCRLLSQCQVMWNFTGKHFCPFITINLMTTHSYWILSFSHCRLYQVRCSLKVSPGKLPIQIETCIPDQNAQNLQTGPCVINNAGASKIFQILYRNEEVALRDVIMFRAHLLGNLYFSEDAPSLLLSLWMCERWMKVLLLLRGNDDKIAMHKSWWCNARKDKKIMGENYNWAMEMKRFSYRGVYNKLTLEYDISIII